MAKVRIRDRKTPDKASKKGLAARQKIDKSQKELKYCKIILGFSALVNILSGFYIFNNL